MGCWLGYGKYGCKDRGCHPKYCLQEAIKNADKKEEEFVKMPTGTAKDLIEYIEECTGTACQLSDLFEEAQGILNAYETQCKESE